MNQQEKEFVKTGTVNLVNACSVYDGLVMLLSEKKQKIKEEIKKSGMQKEQIEHGDYGYFLFGDKKMPRFFARTKPDRIESFCGEHFIGKCGWRSDVNKNPSQYFICGNLFN